jgi:methyltransferase-like protein
VPHNLTDQVNSIKEQAYSNRSSEGGASFGRIRQRIPTRESIDPSKGKKRKKIKTGGRDSILFGTHNIDLSAIEQITDASQVNAISEALVYAKKYMDGEKTIPEILDLIFDDIEEKGLNVIGHQTNENYAMFRKFELAAALNRLRTLKIKQKG